MRQVLFSSVISLLACAPVQRPPPEEADPPVGEPREPRPLELHPDPAPPAPAPKPAPAPAASRTARNRPRVHIRETVLPE